MGAALILAREIKICKKPQFCTKCIIHASVSLCDVLYLNLPSKYLNATSMEMISSPARAIQQQLEEQREPKQASSGRKRAAWREGFGPEPADVERRPHFPRAPLEREDAFIDPMREAQLLLPEQTVASTNIMFDTALAVVRRQPSSRDGNVFTSIYEYLLAIFASAKKRLRGSARQKARMTARGEEALEQLRYLAMLCDASECRTPEEVLAAEGAFGEAYHEILSLSSNLARMSEQEQSHHVHHYKKNFSSILRSTD